MIYIEMEKGITVYVLPEKVKSITHNRREKWAKVCYADGEVTTYVDVIDVINNAE